MVSKLRTVVFTSRNSLFDFVKSSIAKSRVQDKVELVQMIPPQPQPDTLSMPQLMNSVGKSVS